MAILPKAMYMFNPILLKISMTFCMEIEKAIVKCIWKHKRAHIVKATLRKKLNAGGITISDFKLHYRTITMKTPWYWHKKDRKTNGSE
jgi:hypothetical protein